MFAYKTTPLHCGPCRERIAIDRSGIEEFTIYTVKPYNISPDMCQTAKAYKNIKGFKSIRSLKGSSNPLLKIDNINWETQEDAHDAIEHIETESEFSLYRNAMDETHFFGHAIGLNHLTVLAPDDVKENPTLMEFKSYAVKKADFAAHLRGRRRVLNWLMNEVPGFFGIRTYQSLDDAERYFDASFWQSEEHYKWAMNHLRNTPFYQVHALSIHRNFFSYTFDRQHD